mmetsp:Transcript_15231/g.36896  ORF Transcript_15231/g.36896 Transcript_15231/m.36896 type:complete len:88 (-) Transcript_15231:39-302(-)
MYCAPALTLWVERAQHPFLEKGLYHRPFNLFSLAVSGSIPHAEPMLHCAMLLHCDVSGGGGDGGDGGEGGGDAGGGETSAHQVYEVC